MLDIIVNINIMALIVNISDLFIVPKRSTRTAFLNAHSFSPLVLDVFVCMSAGIKWQS